MSIAAIELGGTKTMVTAGNAAGRHAQPIRLPTGTPDATMPAVIAALQGLQEDGAPFDAIGVASFGPLELDIHKPGYGRMRNTPKPGWRGFDLVGSLQRAFNVPIVLETDVNAAALGEADHAAMGCTNYAYITVGTGVGVGVVAGGQPVYGAGHSEGGHVLVRQRRGDMFPGICFAHGACIEGLVSGPALKARFGDIALLNDEHWDMAGDYLAQLCMSLVLIAAPQRIVLGGGVGSCPELLAPTRLHLWRHLGGYIDNYHRQSEVDALLVPAALEHSGLIGALALASAHTRKPAL